jgi:hypothetical protein
VDAHRAYLSQFNFWLELEKYEPIRGSKSIYRGGSMCNIFGNIAVLGCVATLAGCAQPNERITVGSGCTWVAGAWYQLTDLHPPHSKTYAGWGVSAGSAAQCVAQSQSGATNFYAVHSGYQISVVESRPCHQQCAPPPVGPGSIFSTRTRAAPR